MALRLVIREAPPATRKGGKLVAEPGCDNIKSSIRRLFPVLSGCSTNDSWWADKLHHGLDRVGPAIIPQKGDVLERIKPNLQGMGRLSGPNDGFALTSKHELLQINLR
jgi:hypothetical protein